jgi:DNA helicase HerA-like ATPase
MPWRSVEDELREQFYGWEMWGRGWAAWPEPVHLEPPFRPFYGHFITARPQVDDGRHHTTLSRLAAWVRGKPTDEAASTALAPIGDEPEPEPRYLDTTDELHSFILHVPRERVIRPDAMAAFLSTLHASHMPFAFEIVGANGKVAVQVAARVPDERLLLSTLRNYFPDVTAVPGDLLIETFARVDFPAIGVFELALRREFMLPLATFRSYDPDPLIAIVAALEDTEGEDAGAVQILFEGAHSAWAESVFRAVTTNDGDDFFEDEPGIAKLGKQKVMQPLFAATLRVVVTGEDEPQARSRLVRIAGALAQFENPAGNQLFTLNDETSFDPHLDLLTRLSHRSGMLLGLDELSSLVHFPSASVQSKALVGRVGLRSHALPAAEQRGLYLGVNRHAGTEKPVYLTLDRARRHVHVIGASGSGKSNLLLQLLVEDVKQGGGIALLDPHGDLVDDVLARLPEHRLEDVILFDPADAEYPVGFNVLAAHSDLEKTLLASDLVAIFRRLSTSWGDQMHAVLANAIQAFLESKRGGTIADLRKFLIDREFREEFLTTIPDEEIIYYWRKEFPLLSGRPQGPILTRLDSFLRPKLVRQMVVQRENKIDFRSVMDDGKIFLAKLAQGAIGEENAALLGSFLIARFHQTAMSRQDMRATERRPFLIAADECQHFVTPSMASILSGARKYSVGLVLAHQDLTQLQRKDGEVYSSLTANAGTRIVFRVGDSDARALADGFANFTSEDLRALSVGEAICRYDRADHDFNLAVPLVEPIDEDEALAKRTYITERSRKKYGQPPADREKTAPPAPAPDAEKEPDTPAPEPPKTAPREPQATDPPPRPKPPPKASAQPAQRIPVKREEDPTLGRGGAQHKYLQELVKRFGDAQGYRATIEKPTPSGGSVDVALERADGSIAVEISVTSTTSYESGNVAKCLAAGYNRVVVLAPERRRVDAIAKAVRSALLDSERDRVDFLLPEEFLTYLVAQTPPPPSEEQVGGYKVKVSYKKPTDDDAKARQRAVTEVIARSVRKLDE